MVGGVTSTSYAAIYYITLRATLLQLTSNILKICGAAPVAQFINNFIAFPEISSGEYNGLRMN